MAAAAAGESGAPAPAQQPPACRLVAGDDLGVLRVVEVPSGPKWEATAVVAKWGQPDKQLAVHCLACSSSDLHAGGPALLAVGRAGRRLDVLDAVTGVQQASLALPPPAAAAAAAPAPRAPQTAAVTAVAFVPATADRPLQLVAGTADGVVTVCSCSSSSDGGSSDNGGWSISSSFTVGPNLACLAVDSAGTHVVVGGEGFQPAIWELASGSRVWQGKGGKPNAIRLVDKPFTTALAFLPPAPAESGSGASAAAAAGPDDSSSSSSSSSIARRFIAGSAVAKLHLYDTAAGRRPQREAVFGEARVTSIAPEPNGQRAWAANGTGHMQLLVLGSFQLQDALKGAGGSVRALALQPQGGPAAGEPALLASVGLDRFLRLHDTRSRAGRARAYLKQQLSAVAWLPVPAAAAAAAVAQAASPVAAAAASSGAAKKKSNKSKARAAAEGEQQVSNGASAKKRAKH